MWCINTFFFCGMVNRGFDVAILSIIVTLIFIKTLHKDSYANVYWSLSGSSIWIKNNRFIIRSIESGTCLNKYLFSIWHNECAKCTSNWLVVIFFSISRVFCSVAKFNLLFLQIHDSTWKWNQRYKPMHFQSEAVYSKRPQLSPY